MTFLSLVENESLKIVRRNRFTIIMAILVAVISLVSYAEYKNFARHSRRNWRVETQERIANYENMIRRGRISASWARSLHAEIRRLQFYVDHDIDPERPTAPFFSRTFASIAGYLLLPLLVSVLASDLVSAESAEGTDKLLLTRPVRRWKILTSKLVALAIFTTLTLAAGALLSYAISSIALDPRGWNAPVFTGFVLQKNAVSLEGVRQLPLWQDALVAFGLEWFAMLVVAAVSFFLSVIFRSNTASMGTMLAALIAGTILTRVSADWTAGKYLFVTALPLAAYYGGEPPPYDGMSLHFCIALLAVWGLAAVVASYAVFVRRDVFG